MEGTRNIYAVYGENAIGEVRQGNSFIFDLSDCSHSGRQRASLMKTVSTRQFIDNSRQSRRELANLLDQSTILRHLDFMDKV